MTALQGESIGDADIRSKLTAFEEVRRQHPRFKDAFHKTRDFAACGRASRVVIVTGPTGVGKSTLGISLRKQAVIEAKEACEKDPSLVPAVLVTATPPHGRSFNWKDFYVRTLEQLNEPLKTMALKSVKYNGRKPRRKRWEARSFLHRRVRLSSVAGADRS